MKVFVGCLLLFALVGCSSSPISADKADPVPASRLYAFTAKSDTQLIVTRDSGMFGSGCNYRFYINGELAAEFASGEVARFGVKPGRVVLGAKPSAACGGGMMVERDVEVKNGEVLRRRISMSPGGPDISATAY